MIAKRLDITQFDVYNKDLHTLTQGLTVHKDHLVIHKEHGFHNGPYEYLVNTYYDYTTTHFFMSLSEAETWVLTRKETDECLSKLSFDHVE